MANTPEQSIVGTSPSSNASNITDSSSHQYNPAATEFIPGDKRPSATATASPTAMGPSTLAGLCLGSSPIYESRFPSRKLRVPRQAAPGFEAEMKRHRLLSNPRCQLEEEEGEEEVGSFHDNASMITNPYEDEPPILPASRWYKERMARQWEEVIVPLIQHPCSRQTRHNLAVLQASLEQRRNKRIAAQLQLARRNEGTRLSASVQVNGESSAMAEQRLPSYAQPPTTTQGPPQLSSSPCTTLNEQLRNGQLLASSNCPLAAIKEGSHEDEVYEGNGKGKARGYANVNENTAVRESPSCPNPPAMGSFTLHRSARNGSPSNELQPSIQAANTHGPQPVECPLDNHNQLLDVTAPQTVQTAQASQLPQHNPNGRANGNSALSQRSAPPANAPTGPRAQTQTRQKARAMKRNWRDRGEGTRARD